MALVREDFHSSRRIRDLNAQALSRLLQQLPRLLHRSCMRDPYDNTIISFSVMLITYICKDYRVKCLQLQLSRFTRFHASRDPCQPVYSPESTEHQK